MLQWYALFTKARKEFQVAEVLANKGVEVYVPATLVATRRQGKVLRPFFPAYTFARIDFDALGISAIMWTPGLKNVVEFDGRPAAVPERLVERLKTRLAPISEQDYAASFQSGERVRVLDGPFKDFEAVFDKALSGADRVQILLEFIGKAARYEIDASDIAHINPPLPGPRPTSH